MRLHVLIGQRVCQYPGQYAPEALEVIDGLSNEDNPDFMPEKLEELRALGEFEALTIVKVDVDSDEVEKRLFPGRQSISGRLAE